MITGRTFNLPFWVLRFLYVRSTKNLLLWLMEEGPKSRGEIRDAWLETIRNEKELEVMLTLLLRYRTVEEKGKKLQVTQRGRDFLDSINWHRPA